MLLILNTSAESQRPAAPSLDGVPELAAIGDNDDSPKSALTPEEWSRVDKAVARALSWLATQQQRDGSYPTLDYGQPAVTSFCALAFAAHGHVAGEGHYGKQMERAIDFTLSCQKPSGLIALVANHGPRLSRLVPDQIGTAAAYNHAISSLFLSELYGMNGGQRARRLENGINKSLAVTLEMQGWQKDNRADRGGWRYLHDRDELDSDLSVTGWQLMFLRSARNAGFDVPKQPIDEAVQYVLRCFDPQRGTFSYSTTRGGDCSRAMAGAGILALAHAGYHNAPESRLAAQYITNAGFADYNAIPISLMNTHDRYHYGLFLGCQGLYQLGGPSWQDSYPRIVRALLANQQADGSWPADSHMHDSPFGNCYTTALVVLTLGAPNQLLPIFQR
ncbi:MAG TPA: prenyltransferase/squalene oxidase repeat-containing protein [Lacipirellulaceae bacterium]|nr:prenyltransferase/squalene oxidase repeat-containing protein [Lacipirellulaceae bacterium]